MCFSTGHYLLANPSIVEQICGINSALFIIVEIATDSF